MKLSKIAVNRLFDHFDHELDFNPNERVAIMTGPNGYGKTMILRIINAVLKGHLKTLERLPFQELSMEFDQSIELCITRLPGNEDGRSRHKEANLKVTYSDSLGTRDSFETATHTRGDDLPYHLINEIDDYIPDLTQIGPLEWRRMGSRQHFDLDEVIARYADYLPPEHRALESTLAGPDWYENIKREIPVRFIDTERLTRFPSFESSDIVSRRHYTRTHRRSSPERTVRQYSDQLAEKVRSVITEYANLSQELDRSFPARLVEEPTSPTLSISELTSSLAQVETRRSDIISSGLLIQDSQTISLPDIDAMDPSRIAVLAVYTQDALRKLGVFDNLYERVKAFTRIANARFLNKHVSVSRDGLRVSTTDGSDLNVEMLSSGEQHQLVLLYDLLFDISENSLVMIDEPELSLHVAWQREILTDLQAMADLSHFRVLLATHSPQIIGDRWDLTVSLSDVDEQ